MTRNIILILTISFYMVSQAQAEEYGVGVLGLAVPHYMGSGQHYPLVLPFPLFSSLFKQKKKDSIFIYGVDADWNLPISGDDLNTVEPGGHRGSNEYSFGFKNYARRGMGFTPAALFIGAKAGLRFEKVEFLISATPGIQLGHGWDEAGLLSKVQLTWHALRTEHLEFILVGAAKFTNATYNQLYYGVESDQVITGREEFKAKSGYLGHTIALHFHTWKPINSMIFGFFLEYQNMDDSVVKESPLVIRKHNLAAGAGVGFFF